MMAKAGDKRPPCRSIPGAHASARPCRKRAVFLGKAGSGIESNPTSENEIK